ncbi:hypothetical protein ACOSQ3_017780 [Xanthoceras sorbifolium]
MEALRASYTVPSLNYNIIPKAINQCNFFFKPKLMNFQSTNYHKNTSKSFKVFTISSSLSSSPPPPTLDQPAELETKTPDNEKFDWFSAWCPVIPVCDLDKRVPHGKKVLGLDIVAWWDENESSWKVFDDACPHRLAPLSEGRIDKLGRLQCAYHGWCFNGSGSCNLIPQAPPNGPPERKIMNVGPSNWQKACFVPTEADAYVTGLRMWLHKYSGGQINWGRKFSASTLLPTLPREQLMDRYWSHVVNCKSCSCAYKSLNALEVILQVISIVSIGIVAATKHRLMLGTTRNAVVAMAIVFFVASRWLAHFIYKNFHYHDYNHVIR